MLARDGTSVALGAQAVLEPDPELHARLVDAGAVPATVATRDALDQPAGSPDAVAADLQTAAVLRSAERGGIRAAAVLGVSRAAGGAAPLGAEELEALGLRLGEAGYASMAAVRARTR